MRLLVVADLHYQCNDIQAEKKLLKLTEVAGNFDAVLLGGDNARYHHKFMHYDFLFKTLERRFNCPVAFVIGNHELWSEQDARELIYNEYAAFAKEHEAVYLEKENLSIGGWTVVGTYGHYDYSLRGPKAMGDVIAGVTVAPGGYHRWMDTEYITLRGSSPDFCKELLQGFTCRITIPGPLITISHTIPARRFSGHPPSPKNDFLNAYSGSAKLEEILLQRQPKFHICGHTHKYSRGKLFDTTVINTGAHYDKLAYLVIDTEKGTASRRVAHVPKPDVSFPERELFSLFNASKL